MASCFEFLFHHHPGHETSEFMRWFCARGFRWRQQHCHHIIRMSFHQPFMRRCMVYRVPDDIMAGLFVMFALLIKKVLYVLFDETKLHLGKYVHIIQCMFWL